ncbi:GNAT family N-acetyltransferase [Kocuria sp. CPCC 205258]|uniref:GNAT family N-acetyltransferase n=1 Tax=Kocuria sp. CPCC 205258 TaxID=3073552 RepID=UPI0034D6F08F
MRSPGLTIRTATCDDYEAAVELNRQVAPGRDLTREQFQRWLSTTTVAQTDSGEIVGLCHGNHTSATWQSFVMTPEPPTEWRCSYLDTLVVAADHRGHGIGAALLERFLDAARAAGNTWVVLRPMPADPVHGAEELLTFYGAAGFVPLQHRLAHGLTRAPVLGRAVVEHPDHAIEPLQVTATGPGGR